LTVKRYFPQEIIRRKRDGDILSESEIAFMVEELTAGGVTEGQIAAFAMAVFFRGMTMAERVALTKAMMRSGTVLAWSGMDLGGPVIDKHSTGGVGDKISLILAPVIAACGGFCPMISGRGLGHTGGTLDKLEAIPGYRCDPSLEHFRQTVARVGCAIIGQTDDLAPADRRLYAIRDVTATVESIPLITASILSKKLAAGLDALVMDVKFGSGAFLPDLDAAKRLADSIVAVANGAGLAITALLTDMNQVLGRTAGNGVEVREAIDMLAGSTTDGRLYQVTKALAAELLVLGGLCDREAAPHAVDGALRSGTAAERFAAMVSALGGPADLLEAPDKHLPTAPLRRDVIAPRRGFIGAVDTRRIGLAVMELGGGRRQAADVIDPAVGLVGVEGPGFRTGPRRPIAQILARNETDADVAERLILEATTIVDTTPPERPVIADRRTGRTDLP